LKGVVQKKGYLAQPVRVQARGLVGSPKTKFRRGRKREGKIRKRRRRRKGKR